MFNWNMNHLKTSMSKRKNVENENMFEHLLKVVASWRGSIASWSTSQIPNTQLLPSVSPMHSPEKDFQILVYKQSKTSTRTFFALDLKQWWEERRDGQRFCTPNVSAAGRGLVASIQAVTSAATAYRPFFAFRKIWVDWGCWQHFISLKTITDGVTFNSLKTI